MSRVIAAFAQFFDGSGAPLANGFLKFLISGTVNTEKNTYADVNQTLPNANPLQLDGEGRCPNAFGQGIYKIILYDINPVTGLPGTMIQTFDPVVADYTPEGAGGNFDEWNAGTIYQIGQIIIYNGLYYRSHIANNIGNQPDISADSWERIDFLRFWNLDVTYGLDDVVIYGSQLYFSLQAGNLNHIPNTSPAWWDPVGSGTVLLNWMESGTSFVPVVSGYNIGGPANMVGNFYQQDNARHYFGSSQDAYQYFDGTDFFATTAGNFSIATLDTAEIIFATQATNRWHITSDGHFVPNTNLDIGAALLPIGDFYQGDSRHLYIGDSQDIDLTFDGTDFYISIGANSWALLSDGSIEPQTDASFNIGSASNRLKQVSVSDNPTLDDHVVKNAYLTAMLYEEPRLNFFDNGDFRIAQRGTSLTGPLGSAPLIDRWVSSDGSDGTATVSQQAFTPGQTAVPGNPNYYCQYVLSVAATAGIPAITYQTIFDVTKFSSMPLVLSYWARVTSGTIDINFSTRQYFGSGGSATIDTVRDTHTLTTTWQQFITTFTMETVSGKTIGTNNHSQFYFIAPFSTTGTFQVADLQLLPGSDVKAFQRKDYAKSLSECLPYYQKSYEYNTAVGTATQTGSVFRYNSPAGNWFEGFRFQVPMLITPTVILYSTNTGASGNIYNFTQAIDTTNAFGAVSSKGVSNINMTIAANAGDILAYNWTADIGY